MTEKTCGEALMQLLKGYGVTTVFGIPANIHWSYIAALVKHLQVSLISSGLLVHSQLFPESLQLLSKNACALSVSAVATCDIAPG